MKLRLLIAGIALVSCLVGCSASSEPASPPAEDVAAKLNQDSKNAPPLPPNAQAVRDKAIMVGGGSGAKTGK